jgi:hypothetical protein
LLGDLGVEIGFGIVFAIEIPKLGSIWIINGGTVFSVAFIVEIPKLGSIRPFNGGTALTMTFAVEIPMLVSVCIDLDRVFDVFHRECSLHPSTYVTPQAAQNTNVIVSSFSSAIFFATGIIGSVSASDAFLLQVAAPILAIVNSSFVFNVCIVAALGMTLVVELGVPPCV